MSIISSTPLLSKQESSSYSSCDQGSGIDPVVMQRAMQLALQMLQQQEPILDRAENLKLGTQDIYSGQIKNGKPHGAGELKYAQGGNKLKYQGEFADGLPNGEGKLWYQDGDIYVGSFVNGVREGRGEMAYISGSKLSGKFSNGDDKVVGTFTWRDGDYFKGELKDGEFWNGDIYNQFGQMTRSWKEGKKLCCTRDCPCTIQ